MKAELGFAVAAVALALSPCSHAQLAVSVNDGKQLRPGELPASRTLDSLSVIDLGKTPPVVLGTVPTPASLTGPPTTVAVAPDSSFAIVTGSQKIDPADPTKLVPDDIVSVVDLRTPRTPKVIQTLHAGPSVAGVAINKAGTLALIAGSGDDSIWIYAIKGRTLTPAGQLKLDPQSKPTDVAIAPDGKTALVVVQNAGKILKLAIDGIKVTRTGVEFNPGLQPYGVVISRKGDYAYNTNLGGRPGSAAPASGPRIGTISVLDLKANTVLDSVDAGATPEHVSLSPDGTHVQTTIVNGSSAPTTSPNYNAFGLMKVFKVEGATLTPVAETKTGQWCQGATWSKDGKLILLQCAMAKEIEAYRFDGKTLTRDPAATIKLDGRPGAISTAIAR